MNGAQAEMRYQPVDQAVALAVVGKLNPAIFTPAWLRLHDIISSDELEAAKVSVIHPEIADFAIDTLRIQVTPQKFLLILTAIPFVRAADITLAIFGDLLVHTPVYQVGFNLQLHFDLESPDRRTKLGRALAPIEPWGRWGQEVLAHSGGVRTMTMEESAPENRRPGGFRRVQVEPSAKPQLSASGVFMAVNDHYELDGDAVATSDLTRLIKGEFDNSILRSADIIGSIMEFAWKLEI